MVGNQIVVDIFTNRNGIDRNVYFPKYMIKSINENEKSLHL